MLKLLAPLFGFAIFGALFAGLYYVPDEVERSIGTPKYRLGPGEVAPDYIEPAAFGENISVNIKVLSGGPIDVYLLDMDNLTFRVLNGTNRGFDVNGTDPFYNRTYSAQNVTAGHNFTFVADGENRWAVVLVSAVRPHPDPQNATREELSALITEVSVDMRYLDSERKSLVWGYILAAPSLGLVGVAFWLRWKRGIRDASGPISAPEDPRDL